MKYVLEIWLDVHPDVHSSLSFQLLINGQMTTDSPPLDSSAGASHPERNVREKWPPCEYGLWI